MKPMVVHILAAVPGKQSDGHKKLMWILYDLYFLQTHQMARKQTDGLKSIAAAQCCARTISFSK